MAQEQVRRSGGGDDADETGDGAGQASVQHEQLSDDVDSILDEIDGVLEENAEEFVKQFVQKGGE